MANTNTTDKYVDLEDPRFTEINNERETAIADSNATYDSRIAESDAAIDSLITQNNAAAEEAIKHQQEQTDFSIDKIEQQSEQSKKDFTKESKAAYTDYQKQTDAYGVNAEKRAASGLSRTGYSESSMVSMYNAYQNRVAVARETMKKAELEYQNGIREAKLLNSATIAQIKSDAFAKQLELVLQGLQYKNTLLTDKADMAMKIESHYDTKYQDLYDRLYKEAALAEDARQFNIMYGTDDLDTEEETAEETAPTRDSGSGSNKNGPILKPDIIAPGKGSKVEVSTDYYIGPKNPDCKNGTFANGYQPDNVNGQKLSNTGLTISINTTKLNGKTEDVTQNLWRTKDGKYWIWDGTSNEYLELTPTEAGASAYGVFSNGYQPTGIVGHGEVSKTGKSITVAGNKTKSGNTQRQNIWQTKDGKYWVWDGKAEEYIELSSREVTAYSTGKIAYR